MRQAKSVSVPDTDGWMTSERNQNVRMESGYEDH